MRIGINLLFLEPGKVGGSEIFAREIVSRLDDLTGKDLDVIIYCNNKFKEAANFRNITVKSLLVSSQNRLLRFFVEQVVLPMYLFKDKVDIVHSMGYTTPLFTSSKKVTTIFDTQYKSFPESVGKFLCYFYSVFMPMAANLSDLIITSSYFSANEIRKNLHVSNSKIKVIYGSAEKAKHPPVPFEKRGKYIMTGSATYPHKNIKNLVLAFKILRLKYGHKELKLYITGNQGSDQLNVENAIENSSLASHIRFLGWVDRSKYIRLVSNALVFVFPSLYEGFGLPPLEAMTWGTPTVVSKSSSLVEVAAKAGVVVNPYDPEEIAFQINKLLTNRSFYIRQIKVGKKQSEKFSWDKSVEKLVNYYGQIK